MNKTITYLSLFVLFSFGLMMSNNCLATSVTTAWDRPLEFSEISLMFVKNPQGHHLEESPTSCSILRDIFPLLSFPSRDHRNTRKARCRPFQRVIF